MALAKWYKIDFHTHSPASNCFKDKSVTAQQWVEAAQNAGLDAVVLTDHNSVGFISEIDELDSIGIKVFYGVELCVSADFAHIIVIFDDTLTVKEIEDAIIQYLQLPRNRWGDTTINVSEDKLKNLCSEFRDHILVIPAHFASEKGLGKSNINAIKKYGEFVQFDAIEIRNENDMNSYEFLLKNKAINRAALITGSDNPSNDDQGIHSIEGFGKAFTWIKTSSLSFQGLKQVFLDPEHRCINMLRLQEIGEEYNPNDVTHNYVSGMIIDNVVHLSRLDMRFSPGLNCIIGGRGTGKSTIVDAIYYGLERKKELYNCQILDKTLLEDAIITTFYNFGTSIGYKIEAQRERDKLVYKCFDENGIVDDPPEFRVDFYGQKDIYNLLDEDENTSSEEKSPLVRMLDDRIQSRLYTLNDKVNEIVAELHRKATLYNNNRKKLAELPTLKAEVEKADAIMQKFKANGIEEKRKQYESLRTWIKNTQNNIVWHISLIQNTIETFENRRNEYGLTLAKLKDDPIGNKDGIQVINSLLESCDRIIDMLREEEREIEEQQEKYGQSDTHTRLVELHDIYVSAIEDVKIIGKEDIQTVQDTLQSNKERIFELETIQGSQNGILQSIKELISELVRVKLDTSRLRQETIDEMHMEEDGTVFKVLSMAHAKRFKANLQKEFKHEAYDEEYNKLVQKLLKPDNNFEMLQKYYLFVLTTETGDLKELGIDDLSNRFINNWKEKYKNVTLESLLYVMPEDKVDISITDNGNTININDGSPGQKCAALLTFILNSGHNPLIIDQPEDDLDNSLIYSFIVKSIRKIKNTRQIIVVTHNPNIPVLGDAEGIIVLERDKNGKVVFRNDKKAGCIEEKSIRDGVCAIMEGGEEAFRKREAKYLVL